MEVSFVSSPYASQYERQYRYDCALSHLGLGQLGRLAPVVVGGDAVEGGVLARGEAAQLAAVAVAAVADLEAAGAEDLAALPPLLLLLLLGPTQRGELPLVGPGGGGGGGLGGAPVGGVAAAGAGCGARGDTGSSEHCAV